nr:hypothetical protein CFP56_03546 [Quercus suber]
MKYWAKSITTVILRGHSPMGGFVAAKNTVTNGLGVVVGDIISATSSSDYRSQISHKRLGEKGIGRGTIEWFVAIY